MISLVLLRTWGHGEAIVFLVAGSMKLKACTVVPSSRVAIKNGRVGLQMLVGKALQDVVSGKPRCRNVTTLYTQADMCKEKTCHRIYKNGPAIMLGRRNCWERDIYFLSI